MARASKMLLKLVNLVLGHDLHDSEICQREMLASVAYELRHLGSVRIYLEVCVGGTLAEKILREILFLGRIKSAYLTFLRCATEIPAFCDILFEFVPDLDTVQQCPPSERLTFAEALNAVHLENNAESVGEYIDAQKPLEQVRNEFANHQNRPPRIHSEIKIIMHLLENDEDLTDFFPYIGCSKLTCFLCMSFITVDGRFTTRGSHGTAYSQWTLPDCALSCSASNRLVVSLQEVKARILKVFQIPRAQAKPRMAESSAGVTQLDPQLLISSDLHDIVETIRRKATLQKNVLFMKCDSMFRMADNAKMIKNLDSRKGGCVVCSNCGAPAIRQCVYCSALRFCSERCAQTDWKHVFLCRREGRPDAADRFVYTCRTSNVNGLDEEITRAYGFSKLGSFHARLWLFDVYKTVIECYEVDSRSLLMWQKSNSLARHIRSTVAKSPLVMPDTLRVSLSWLLANEHVVDCSVPEFPPISDAQYRAAYCHIYGSNTIMNVDELKSWLEAVGKHPSEVFDFYAAILGGQAPFPRFSKAPGLEDWIIHRMEWEVGVPGCASRTTPEVYVFRGFRGFESSRRDASTP